jgi:hypothetical protein
LFTNVANDGRLLTDAVSVSAASSEDVMVTEALEPLFTYTLFILFTTGALSEVVMLTAAVKPDEP